MMSNAPLDPLEVASSAGSGATIPEDMLPSRLAAAVAHFGTVQEFLGRSC